MPKQVVFEDDVLDAIDQIRGSRTFEECVTSAIKAYLNPTGSVVDILAHGTEGPLADIYVAVVMTEDGNEAPLLFRHNLWWIGDVMLPVMAKNEEGMEQWNELCGLEMNAMHGPPVRWRRWLKEGSQNLDWLRRELEVEDE